MTNTLADAFRQQAVSCGGLGSPFMEQLCRVLADHFPQTGPLAEACAAFDGPLGPNGISLPLRIAGGLHGLVLSGAAPALAAVYPPNDRSEADLVTALQHVFNQHRDAMLAALSLPPQTNEIRRSAALIAGAAVAKARFGLPIHLSELGASGGLNLWWDHYALSLPDNRCLGAARPVVSLAPDWTGPLPPDVSLTVASRRGVDLNPLDAGRPADALRLSSYLWPDQPQRLEMTRKALALGSAGVDRGDAAPWLQRRLDTAPTGHLHIVQNTVAWQYFPASVQAACLASLEQAGAQATRDRPLAWLQLETDNGIDGPGAALTLRLWPSGETLPLARADFHGRWIDWRADLT